MMLSQRSRHPNRPTMTRTMCAYLSGPITGMPDLNREAFSAAEAALQAHEVEVINPLRNGLPPDAAWADHMRADIAALVTQADIMVLLPDFLHSAGARAELNCAHALGIPALLLHEALDDLRAGKERTPR